MKKTNNPAKVLGITLVVAAVATAFIALLEELFGADKVFFGALCMIPVCLIWIMKDNEKRAERLFKEREKAWRHNCDLPHRQGHK